MKKLFIILCLVLAGCSKEDPERKLVEVRKYYLSLSDVCKSTSNIQTFEVSKQNYDSTIAWEEKVGSCETWYEIPDVKREVWYEGYYNGSSIEIYEEYR